MKQFIKKNKRKLIIVLILLIVLTLAFVFAKKYEKIKAKQEKNKQIEEVDKKEYEKRKINIEAEGITDESTPFIVKAVADGEKDIYEKGHNKIVLKLVKGKKYKFYIATAVNKDGSIYDTNVELKDNIKMHKIEKPTKEQIEENLKKISEFAKKINDEEISKKAKEYLEKEEEKIEELKPEEITEEKVKELENTGKINHEKAAELRNKSTVIKKQENKTAPVQPAPKPQPQKPVPAPKPQPKPQPKPNNDFNAQKIAQIKRLQPLVVQGRKSHDQMERIVLSDLNRIMKKYGPTAKIGGWSFLSTYMGQFGGGNVTNYRYEGEITTFNENTGAMTFYYIINNKITSVRTEE